MKIEFLDLSDLQFHSTPFEYFTCSKFISYDLSSELLHWFEHSAPWHLVERDFYEQYEFSFYDADLPQHLSFVARADFLNTIRQKMEGIFDTRLDPHLDFCAHKLVSGQTIRIHNDFVPGEESHRLTVQLNREWSGEHGGYLLLFNSDDPSDVHKIIPPHHQSAVAFRISHLSNHAVSKIHEGNRYTLVFSFYAPAE